MHQLGCMHFRALLGQRAVHGRVQTRGTHGGSNADTCDPVCVPPSQAVIYGGSIVGLHTQKHCL